MQRLLANGGIKECEDAVVKALDWFQTTQADNGAWAGNYTVAYTGLALLAYLGHCETPLSVKYGDTVTNAILYLVDVASGGFGDVVKPAVTIQAVEAVDRGGGGRGIGLDRCSLNQVEIQVAVAVVIQQDDTRSHVLGHVLPAAAVMFVAEVHSELGGDLDKAASGGGEPSLNREGDEREHDERQTAAHYR